MATKKYGNNPNPSVMLNLVKHLLKLTFYLLLTANLLQAQTPRLVVPVGHKAPIRAAMFPPGNWGVLTLGHDYRAIMWDLEGRPRIFFGDSIGPVGACTFIDSGYLMAQENRLILYSWEGVAVKEIGRGVPYAYITSLTTSSIDPSKFLSGHEDGTARLWNSDGDSLGTFKSNSTSQAITSAVFFPDERIMLCYENGETSLWNNRRKLTNTFKSNEKVISAEMSQDGKTVLTISLKGTAILWDVQSGKQIETSSGTIRARISPDGRRILQDSTDQNLFEFFIKNGAGTRVNDKGEYVQNKEFSSLVFSVDGKMAITVGYWKMYAKIWDLSSRIKITTLIAHSPVNRIAQFTPDGRNIVMACDSSIKRWTLFKPGLENFKLTDFELSVPQTLSMDCTKAISTSLNNTSALWDIQSGKKISVYPSRHTPFTNYSPYEISPDGKLIAVIGKDILLYDTLGNLLQRLNGDNRSIESVAFTPDNQHVLTSDRNGVAILYDLNGSVVWKDTVFSRNRLIGFLPKAVHDSLIESYTIPIRDANNNILRSYNAFFVSDGITPDGNKFLIRDDKGASLFDLSGKELRRFDDPHIDAIAFSPRCENDPVGGKFLLASQYRSSKIWDTPSGKELATLIAIDSNDWVVTTPSGLFDASPGAMQMMYFLVNYEGANEVVELEQLKETYYEPGLLPKLLGFSDEPLREVEGLDTIRLKLYPAVEMQLDTAENKLHIQLRPRNGGVGKLSIFINGKEVKEEANPPRGFERLRDTSLTINLADYARYFLSDSLNEVSVRAYNAEGWLKSAAHSVEYRPVFAKPKGEGGQGAAPIRLEGAPNLFILSVGTSDYVGRKLDLKYAAKDAVDIAGALEQIGKQLLKNTPGKVFSTVLTTDSLATKLPPTKANIQKAFEDIKKNAKAEDILVVYFSGHGIAMGNEFYYLTQAMGSFEVELEGKGKNISNTELTRWITGIPALKQVLILDACNSGKVVESLSSSSKGLNASQIRALERLKDRTGMFVLSGSAADKLSYESGKFDQGLLTYSLLQGMKILGSKNESRVDVMQWFQRSCDEVPLLAKDIQGVQTPMLVGPLHGSFDVGIVNKEVNITLKEELPVVIRCSFLNEDLFVDDLGLTEALEIKLQEKSQGAKPQIIYVDVSDYPGAFSIRGLFSVRGETVKLRGQLFKGNTPVGKGFQLPDEKNPTSKDPGKLANMILGKVWLEIMKK